jgi:hypothetical protein
MNVPPTQEREPDELPVIRHRENDLKPKARPTPNKGSSVGRGLFSWALIIASHGFLIAAALHLSGYIEIPGVPRIVLVPSKEAAKPTPVPTVASIPKPAPPVVRNVPRFQPALPRPQRPTPPPTPVVVETPEPAQKTTTNPNPSALEILLARGLTREGNLFILKDEEASFASKVDVARPLYKEADAVGNRLTMILTHEMEFRGLQNERALVQKNIDDMRVAMRFMPGRTNFDKADRAAAQQQLAALELTLNNQLAILDVQRRNLSPPPVKNSLNNEFMNKRKIFLDAARNARSSCEEIQTRYEELRKDESITQALTKYRDSKGVAVKLGPSDNFTQCLNWLTTAEKMANAEPASSKTAPSGKSKKGTKGRS